MVNNPFSGFYYLMAGFGLISKPGLRRYVILPLIINIVLFIILLMLLFHYMDAFNHWFESLLPTWLQWLGNILWLFFFVGFFLIFIYAFVTIGNIVAAPFNSLLAEKVEQYLTGKMPEARGLLENIKDVPRILGRQFAIIGYYLPRAIVLLVLFFIPLAQPFAVVLWFIFNAWFMALTYIDYPTDNHRIPLNDVRAWLGQRRWTSLGFGASVLIASMIPVLNFFTIPAAAAAATRFWIEESQSGIFVPGLNRPF
ncbi:sulfate transporter CysZ [Aquicella lusitana]|uniref:Sulfate transporter CysZ n=1 Tax=Aquicella lusitana TaxID=254246 RepID=A0A370GB59_9COXI|nr:sulfate transporter CysZ [Aquicella lusitana]RDI40961.1 CysZ protein [Aquicella lusitana]VVC73634.1 Sulfate transporter CysZ [Aquicella lusitana]